MRRTSAKGPPRRAPARLLPPTAWLWFLASTTALSIIYAFLPIALWKEPLYDGLVMSAFVAIGVGIVRYRPARTNQWLLILVAMGGIAAAEWVWFANDVRGINPLPGWGELLDLSGRVVLLVALARLSADRGRSRDRLAVIDAAVIGCAVSALGWTFVFGQYFDRSELGVLERLTSAGYVAFDVALLVGFVLLLFTIRQGNTAIRLLCLGLGILVIGDFVWLTLLAHNSYTVGIVSDALWPIAYCAIGAAALHPTMGDLHSVAGPVRAPGRARLLILPLAVVALPTGGLVADVLHIQFSPLDDLVVGLGTIAIGAAVAVRVLGLMRSVEDAAAARGQRRTEALVRESLDVVAIIDVEGCVTYVSPPLERVLGWSASGAIGQRLDSVVVAAERPLARRYFARMLARDFGTPLVFTINAMARSGASLLMEIACVNRLDDPEINGIVISARDISERARLEQEVEYYALHDRLTRLANRSLLVEHVDAAVRGRTNERGAVFVLDLDDFKSINDTIGHAAADELFVALSARLRTCVRPGDTLARLSGDEFAVFFSKLDRADVGTTAQRMLDVLQLPLVGGATQLSVGASLGIRVLGSGESAQTALRDAEIAMYEAKRAGKRCWKLFDPDMGARAARRVRLTADLPGAWKRGEMYVHYQPIVDMRTGTVRGAEALARWTHPAFGVVSPDEFILLAEQTGVVRELGLEIMREATRNAAVWRSAGTGDFYVSVNVSPVQIDDTLPDIVQGILVNSDLDPTALLIEITENVVLGNVDASLPVLEALRARGIRIAIDDFGTGYSSLAYAHRFPIDLVKIDQSFTRDLDAKHTGIVPTIIQLAATLGATLVAEGVETAEQATVLLGLGCDLAQGFLYSPGVCAESMAAIVVAGVLAPIAAVAPALIAAVAPAPVD